MKITIEYDNAQEAMAALGQLTGVIENNVEAAKSEAPVFTQTVGRRQRPDAADAIGHVVTGVDLASTPDGTAVTPVVPTPAAPVEDGVLIDARGFPWDKRIHSSNKKQYANDTWMKRRNITDEETAAVEAELQGAAPIVPEVPAATPPVPVVPNAAAAALGLPTPPAPTAAADVPYLEIIATVTAMLGADPDLGETIVEIVKTHGGTENIAALEGATAETRVAVAAALKGLK